MRKPFIAGNWKLNTDSQSSVALAKAVAAGSADVAGERVTVAVIPPFVYLQAVAQAVSSSAVAVGGRMSTSSRRGRSPARSVRPCSRTSAARTFSAGTPSVGT